MTQLWLIWVTKPSRECPINSSGRYSRIAFVELREDVHIIGMATGKISRKASPDDTYAATFAALKAGAHGVILSRKYSEMRLANLDAAGRAVREVLK